MPSETEWSFTTSTPDELRDLFEWAREQGYTKDETVEETNRYASLEALIDDTEE